MPTNHQPPTTRHQPPTTTPTDDPTVPHHRMRAHHAPGAAQGTKEKLVWYQFFGFLWTHQVGYFVNICIFCYFVY